MLEKIKFYQTGSNTVGNRLLNPAMRTIQSSADRPNGLISGHRACQGCGEALGTRYAIDAAMKATNGNIMVVNATGCLEVFSTPYPESAWRLPWVHSLFGNTAAVGSGLAAAAAIRAKKNGKPTTIATEVAATIILKPNDFLPSGAIFTAKGEAIDQKIACAQATPILEVIKVAKVVDTVDSTWLKTKRPTTVNSNFFRANFDAIIIKGRDAIITTQAYTVISIPA